MFEPILNKFLETHPTKHQQLLKQFIYTKARQWMRKNPATTLAVMNNSLKNFITKARFEQFMKQQEQKQKRHPLQLSVSTIHPIKKRILSRKSQSCYDQQQQQSVKKQQQQTVKQQQQQRGQQLKPVITRLKKPNQTDQFTKITYKNMKDMLTLDEYKLVFQRLMEFMEKHGTDLDKVYIVDAPNLLYKSASSFLERQRMTKTVGFLAHLRREKKMTKRDLIIIVSQMNIPNPTHGKRIVLNKAVGDNVFYIQVGCIDDMKIPAKNCFQTIKSNEVDDFVRLDLMTRLADRFPHHKFITLSDDKGSNWRLLKTI